MFTFWCHANLLAEVINYLNAAVHKELKFQVMIEVLKALYFFIPKNQNSQSHGELLEKEIKTWGSVVVKMNLTDKL